MGIGADFDERLMTALASAGTGAFYYLAKLEVLARFLDAELLTASQTVAYGATLEIKLEPGIRVNSVMGLPFEQRGTRVTVPIGSLYSGHERTLWITVKVPTARRAEFQLGSVGARFRIADRDHETDRHPLPHLRCVDSYSEFRDAIRTDVWERAMLNESLGRSQERFGDAIASGTAADIDREYAAANRQRKLASELGVESVVKRLDQLERSARIAKKAQRSSAPVRRAEAKRQKASGYIERNKDSYLNADPRAGF
jgi:Ca-activated chloride channel family protein